MASKKNKETLRKLLDDINYCYDIKDGLLHYFDADDEMLQLIDFLQKNPNATSDEAFTRANEIDGIFPDENGNYKPLEIVDGDELED